MDVREIKYGTTSVDIIIDKANDDTLCCYDNDVSDVTKMLKGVDRLLKLGHLDLQISFNENQYKILQKQLIN